MSITDRQRAHTLTRDSAKLDNFLNDALRNIDTALAGWPTEPSEGATTPPSIADDESRLTGIEAAAHTHDPARTDLETMRNAMSKALPWLQTAAAIAQRWATWQVDGATVQARLATIEASIWCTNCARHGDHEPRAEGVNECERCTILRRRLNRPAPRDLIELWRRRGKLYDSDIDTWIRNDAAERKRRQRANKTANVSQKKTPA